MVSAFLELLETARPRIRPPLLIAMGAPRLVADLVIALGVADVSCFQFDLYQAGRLRDELTAYSADAPVLTAADLWDLPRRFGCVLIPSPPRGERELKRDLVEQAYHVLVDDGRLVVLSQVAKDQFYPPLVKKTFGKVALATSASGTVLWSMRHGEKPRRRHEVTFHVRDGTSSVPLLSRPGVFSHGRLDDGARALIEGMIIRPGDRAVDLGCGLGAVGILAARRGAKVTFIDSHLRAVALAEHNTRANSVADFVTLAAAQLEGLCDNAFDVALANPPYYAQQGIARLFIDGAQRCLVRGGQLFLVTKQADLVGEIVAEVFGEPTIELRRGYVVFAAKKW